MAHALQNRCPVVGSLLTTTALLRLYMQHQRIPLSARSGNPLGRFIFALTDWIVLPLRRVIPALGRWDMASLTAAFLIQLAHFAVLWSLNGFGVTPLSIVVLALLGLVRLSLSGLTAMVLVYAVLSWVQTQSFLSELLDRLVTPLLAPIRKVLPLVGGVDLSPLVLLVVLQIFTIVLGDVQYGLLSAVAG
ncbi:MAG: YggT family protein [Betaproteobacteria bacterium]|nr:YggT family protein [Betaproteobacteria bacterium]